MITDLKRNDEEDALSYFRQILDSGIDTTSNEFSSIVKMLCMLQDDYKHLANKLHTVLSNHHQ